MTGTLDVLSKLSLSSTVPVTATYAVASDGRGTGTIGLSMPILVVFYMISDSEAKVLGADGNPLLLGTVNKQ
jgi:hypothetical protein